MEIRREVASRVRKKYLKLKKRKKIKGKSPLKKEEFQKNKKINSSFRRTIRFKIIFYRTLDATTLKPNLCRHLAMPKYLSLQHNLKPLPQQCMYFTSKAKNLLKYRLSTFILIIGQVNTGIHQMMSAV